MEQVQPVDLDASEIEVRIGATWIAPEIYREFMEELFDTPGYLVGRVIDIRYSEASGAWNISGKNADSDRNVLTTATYGTSRVNAYKILEETLNLKDVRIYDTKIDAEGNEIRVLNKKETMLATQKQDAIKEAFKDWIFRDQERREKLCRIYNDRFNSIRPREYDGSHLTFPRQFHIQTADHKWYDAAAKVAQTVSGGVLQYRANKTIVVGGLTLVLYGRLDCLKAGDIKDIKFSSSYDRGKYFSSTQHPTYFEMVPEAKTFTYLVSNGSEVWTERYYREETPSIIPTISDFLEWLDALELAPLYKKKWLAL